MILFGLDGTAWVLLGGFLLVLLVGIVFGLLLARTDARVSTLRVENRRLARQLGRVSARNAQLAAGRGATDSTVELRQLFTAAHGSESGR